MKIKTSELSGAALDWAVAKAEDEVGIDFCLKDDGSVFNVWTEECGSYRPSEDWEIAGPLIAGHAIGFVGHDSDNWKAFSSPEDVTYQGVGPTHLVAACRLIVSAKLGNEIEVPEELQP